MKKFTLSTDRIKALWKQAVQYVKNMPRDLQYASLSIAVGLFFIILAIIIW